MKKTLLLSLLASTLIFASGETKPVTSSLSPTTLNEEGDYISSIPISIGLLGGIQQGDGDNDEWENMFGAELAFECLFSQDVRSQLQYMYYNVDGLTMQQLSANPHFVFYFDDLGESVEFGVGPHFGITQVEKGNDDDIIFTYGLGTSVRTNIADNIYVGAEARYEWTTDATLGGKDDSYNNAKVFAKVGYSF